MPKYWVKDNTYRHQWLSSKLPGCYEAKRTKTLPAWYRTQFTQYFAHFHWSVESDDEPPPDFTYLEPTDAAGIKHKNDVIQSKQLVRRPATFKIPLTHTERTANPKLVYLANPHGVISLCFPHGTVNGSSSRCQLLPSHRDPQPYTASSSSPYV